MVHTIESISQIDPMLFAPHAIVLVSVPWSPWPNTSRDILRALESTRNYWSPKSLVEFFDLWPEKNDELNLWFEAQCVTESAKFELHGHGFGPLWWLICGKVLDCLAKPYLYSLEEIQHRSSTIFQGA